MRDSTTSSAKYIEVANTIRTRIVEGRLQPGKQLPSQPHLIEEFDVSQPTIQKAITTLLEDGFLTSRRRVGVFVADNLPHLSNYAIILPSSLNPSYPNFQSRFFESLTNASTAFNEKSNESRQTKVIHIPSVDGAETSKFRKIADDLYHKRLAGVIIAGGPRALMNHSIFEETDIKPVIITGEVVKGYSCVIVRSVEMRSRAYQRLKSAGRKRIALLNITLGGYRPVGKSDDTYDGKTPIPPQWNIAVHENAVDTVTNIVRLMLSVPPDQRPDGLIISDDNLAEYVFAAILASGVSVPDELSVISHANFPDIPRQLIPVDFIGFHAHEVLATAINLCQESRDLPFNSEPVLKYVEPEFGE